MTTSNEPAKRVFDTWQDIANRLRTEVPDRVLMLKGAIAIEALAEELDATPPATPVQPTASVEAVAELLAGLAAFDHMMSCHVGIGYFDGTEITREWDQLVRPAMERLKARPVASEAERLERQTFKDAAAINVENDRLREALHDLLTRPTDGAARQRARAALASLTPAPTQGDGGKADRARKIIHEYVGQAASAATSGLSVDDLEGIADDLFAALFEDTSEAQEPCGCPTPKPYDSKDSEARCPICDGAPTPSPSPVSAPSPAGGVREAIARIIDPHSFVPYEPTGAAEDAVFADMVKWSLEDAYRKADRILALSSPATPEPVSAPANGEVVAFPAYGEMPFSELGLAVKAAQLGWLEPYPFDPEFYPGHQIVGTINFNSLNRIVTWFVKRALALSNPAPGHGEGVPVAHANDSSEEKN